MTSIILFMGHSRDDKAASHDRIVEIAARRIREAGADGPGVAEIMREAGLTHGGFYKHFSSRDALMAEAAQRAFEQGRAGAAQATDGADDPLAAFVDWYASEAHRDGPGDGCAVVALGADAGRGDGDLRDAYGRQVENYLGRLAALIGPADDEAVAAQQARVALTTLVGAVLVARAVTDPELSARLLADARAAVLALRSGPAGQASGTGT